MQEINNRYLLISKGLLGVANLTMGENKVIIPLLKSGDNHLEYDELYAYLGENAGFLIDITHSQLYLNIMCNIIGQLNFNISATYQEFSLEDIPNVMLENYNNQISVLLSDEEFEDIYPTLLKLFDDLCIYGQV